MNFESEDDLRQAYREASSVSFETEEPVGYNLIKNRAPRGLGGARCPQADLFGEAHRSGPYSHIIAECKLAFELRAIGQLLWYHQLQRHELIDCDEDIKLDRRLVIGSRPTEVIPSVCSELDVTLEIPVAETWQDITQTASHVEGEHRSDLTPVLQWMQKNQSNQLDSSGEEQVLRDMASEYLPDVSEESLYREIHVGNQQFSEVSSKFRADAIGYVPSTEQFYIIEVKTVPNISGFLKALGQAVTYASLLRQDWELATEQVIPTVLIDKAPWHADLHRKTIDSEMERDTKKQEMYDAVFRLDSAVIRYNQIERYQ